MTLYEAHVYIEIPFVVEADNEAEAVEKANEVRGGEILERVRNDGYYVDVERTWVEKADEDD